MDSNEATHYIKDITPSPWLVWSSWLASTSQPDVMLQNMITPLQLCMHMRAAACNVPLASRRKKKACP